jgi:hypothetical protein
MIVVGRGNPVASCRTVVGSAWPIISEAAIEQATRQTASNF